MNPEELESRLRRLEWTPLPADLRREVLQSVPGESKGAAWLGRPRHGWMLGALAAVWLLIVGLRVTTPDTTPTHPVSVTQEEFRERMFERAQMIAHLDRYGRLPDPERMEFIFELERKPGS